MSKRVWLTAGVAYVFLFSVALVLASLGGAGSASPKTARQAARSRPGFGPRQMAVAIRREKLHQGGEERDRVEHGDKGGEAGSEALSGPNQERNASIAYPNDHIDPARTVNARRQYAAKPSRLSPADFRPSVPYTGGAATNTNPWTELGPITPVVPDLVTYTGRATTNAGRTTAIAVSPTCDTTPSRACRVWVAAAGGAIWRTDNALDASPTWTPVDTGLTTQSFSSLVVDPNDPSGNTLYAGSGEGSASSDSEAGLGLFKTTDGGDHWALVPGSADGVATDRAIYAIAVDPNDPKHLYIGTALARHGMSGTWGGRRTPPNAPPLGVWETKNGGTSFKRIFSQPGATQDPATGADRFQGGITKLELRGPVLYASVNAYGLYRMGDSHDTGPSDGGPGWHQVFTSGAPGEDGDRTEFAVTTAGGKTRIYVGDATPSDSQLYRTDNADVDAATLNAGGSDHTGWMSLSSPVTNSRGFASYNYCQGQCDYDDFVEVDPTNPDTVYLGGSMNYDELVAFGSKVARSNGRAVIRSRTAGASFTDMTNDAQSPPTGMHPDQHAMAFDPANPKIWFVGSDGGVIRSNGRYVDGSGVCADQVKPGTGEFDFCTKLLKSVPARLDNLNDGLKTLQFGDISVNPKNQTGDVMGGTQDNGTWVFGGTPTWFESIGGDGGNSGFTGDGVRMHTYYGPSGDVNFTGTDTTGWDYVTQPMDSTDEAFSFYVPMITDPSPAAKGTMFMGGQYVWRTQDNGGDQAALDGHCGEYTTYDGTITCGDWVRIGRPGSGNLSREKASGGAQNFISALGRSPADTGTLWAGMRNGTLYITRNASAADPSTVSYKQISTPSTPGRFVSNIEVDPADPNHAFISYSGYGAYTPGQPQHLLEARYDPKAKAATFTDRSYDLGDQPATALGVDWARNDVYLGTDFGVLRLPNGATAWEKAANGLPGTAVYDLAVAPGARVLYAGTHGRGIWRVALPPAPRP